MDEKKQLDNHVHPSGELAPTESESQAILDLKDQLTRNVSDLDERARVLLEKEHSINTQSEALVAKERILSSKSDELAERERTLIEREHNLEQRERDNISKFAQIEQDFIRIKNDTNKNSELSVLLHERERDLAQKEDSIRSQIIEELRMEIAENRSREFAKLDEELAKERTTRIEAIAQETEKRRRELEQEISEMKSAAKDKIAAEKKVALDEVLAKQEENNREVIRLQKEAEKIENDLQEIENKKNDLIIAQNRVEYKERQLDERMANWEQEVEIRFNGRDHEYNARITAQEEAITNLRKALETSENRAGALESAQMVYGDLPVMQKTIDDLRNANEKLREEISHLPSVETAADCERYKARTIELERDVESMRDDIDRARSINDENENLQRQIVLKDKKIQDLQWAWDESQEQLKACEERIDRLTASKTTPADRDNRAESIKQPYLTAPFAAQPVAKEEASHYNELTWLNNIGNLCDEYGVSFPKRILYAFHTSLKIANWSTITVLAGVSGTGKSELPRLYSAFGGINFINVPVQPNWDSQESMLGFFNSIDNKFDAQPMLRFLYQCTNELSSNMAIVLLDEMNLAHVEHYFADFLSKLESRRSHAKDVPSIDVSLGAGVAPYELPLSRNVLYCGTMNQDETTKSLSDKVLDRGIIINFPRPRHLIDRDGARNITSFSSNKNIQPLSHSVWNSWIEKQIKFEGKQRDELNRYRGMLEDINDHLAEVGRAIGHRVWQSIEHYVMNYPDVRKAFYDAKGELTDELQKSMHIAVEDQLVQKVMPKLRGIDTSGKSMEKCLDPIRMLLVNNDFNLDNDYERACEMGYGQFMWCSAEYIGDGEEE